MSIYILHYFLQFYSEILYLLLNIEKCYNTTFNNNKAMYQNTFYKMK